jgi:hypothetical protein
MTDAVIEKYIKKTDFMFIVYKALTNYQPQGAAGQQVVY